MPITNREPVIPQKRKAMSKKERYEIGEARDWICYWCKKKIDPSKVFHIDHWEAREIGGNESRENKFPMHPPCHIEKTKADQTLIAKIRRLFKKTFGLEIKKPSKLQSQGFNNRFSRAFDGTIKEKKKEPLIKKMPVNRF